MLRNNRKFVLMTRLFSGLLLTSTTSLVLASCINTNNNNNLIDDTGYIYSINWLDPEQVSKLVVDNQGLIYASSAKDTIIAVSPKVELANIKIPSSVRTISGYKNITVDPITKETIYTPTGAFEGMNSLISITLDPNGTLYKVGVNAFKDCSNLQVINNLKDSLVIVDDGAFQNCSSLSSINLSNVTSIGEYAFQNCTSLNEVSINKVKAVSNYAFQNCSNLLNISFDNATSIGNYAFQNCAILNKVNLNKITIVGEYAFQNCSNLLEIDFTNVKSIGSYAFNNAFSESANLELSLPSLETIGTNAFQDALGLNKLNLNNNNKLNTISDYAFYNCSFVEVDLTNCSSLTTIGKNAFSNNKNLISVYLPLNDSSTMDSSLTSLNDECFKDSSNLTTVAAKISNKTGFIATKSINHIGNLSFAGTKISSIDLEDIYLDSADSIITDSSFDNMDYLEEIELFEGMTSVTSSMFTNSGYLSSNGFSLILPSTITSFDDEDGEGIFSNSALVSIDMSKIQSYSDTIGTSNVLPENIFNGCTKLQKVILKPGTTTIATNAFKNTTSLLQVICPENSDDVNKQNGFTATSNLTSISADAFKNAFASNSNAILDLSAMNFISTPSAFSDSNIKSIILPTTTRTIDEDSFNNMTQLTNVNFSQLKNLKTIWKQNFNNTLLNNIDLSNSVFDTISSSNSSDQLFTNLPNDCVVSLPTSLSSSFNGIFTTKNNSSATFSFPNGINSSFLSISSNTLQNLDSSNITSNLQEANFSNIKGINSIGTNTFFGSKNIGSITLKASTIQNSNKGIFTSKNLSANSNTSFTPYRYATGNVPFGNNSSLTSLTYTDFSGSETTINSMDNQEDLFAKTNQSTWTSVARIINSFSSYIYSNNNASLLPANISSWNPSNDPSSLVNNDASSTWNASINDGEGNVSISKVLITNSYSNSSDKSTNSITITASDSIKTFIHNNVVWTYKNTGSSITITGNVNMYRASNNSALDNSFLVFFDRQILENGNVIPSPNQITITLSIANS